MHFTMSCGGLGPEEGGAAGRGAEMGGSRGLWGPLGNSTRGPNALHTLQTYKNF